jgi:hypothetical protein
MTQGSKKAILCLVRPFRRFFLPAQLFLRLLTLDVEA